jgi:7-cyano-7-deazaguanine synthase in queuosine biosynthesis
MSVECIYGEKHTKYKAENSKNFAKLLGMKFWIIDIKVAALLTETFGTFSSTI